MPRPIAWTIGCMLLCGLYASPSFAVPTVTVAVDAATVTNPSARRLLGTSFDGRTGIHQQVGGGASVPTGYFDQGNQLIAGVAPLWSQLHLTTVRYPGNGVDQIDWRETVGPMALRAPQPYAGNSVQTQVIHFGFDDFMAMLASHNAPGEPAPEVQIMVSTDTSLTVPTQAGIIQMAADWVEYANCPDDSSNLGGGVDWAHERALTGHPEPYGIRIWNIGNEPWGPTQAFNFNVAGNAAAFAALAQPIITAMLAIDPTILITVPSAAHPLGVTVDNAAQAAWDNVMLSQLGGQIFGLSEHIFHDGSAARGVAASAGSIDAVLARIAASAHPDVRLLLGDQAPFIPGSPTSAQIEFGMQWQSALTTADFLLMLAGKRVELANFWVYGSTQSTWHPIRRNSNGTYTILPAAQLYAQLGQSLHDQALATTTTSPASLDGTAGYSVRAGAFRAGNGSGLTLVVVNRDTLVDHTVAVAGLEAWSATSARLLSGASANAEVIDVAPVSVGGANADYSLPRGSILIVDHVPAATGVFPEPDRGAFALGAPRPNPASGRTRLALSGVDPLATRAWVHDVAGRIVRELAPAAGEGFVWDLCDSHGVRVKPGVYLVRATGAQGSRTRRVVVLD
ncbi:MAG: hypothetical protein IT348_03835 [Candidatus Eisenbacteria bacterium]|nr:hypothetical protein [Candidatus Eisenbacteria bacterium]